jgi:hypothetical protein
MTLDELIEGMTPKFAFLLGGLTIAHGERKRARQIEKERKAERDKAKEARSRLFGFYGSDGEISHLDDCEQRLRAAVSERVSKEKHFKKLSHEFQEAGGDPTLIEKLQEILNKA